MPYMLQKPRHRKICEIRLEMRFLCVQKYTLPPQAATPRPSGTV
jgi:hypothetical protein